MLEAAQKTILSQRPLILVGYGAQGRAEALNLRRMGISFALGLRTEGASFKKACEDGFEPMDWKALKLDNAVVVINLPDQVHALSLAQLSERGSPAAWVFAHGFSTHFGTVPKVPGGPAHILVAPKGAAHGLIEFVGTPRALPAILAVENSTDPFWKTWAAAYAQAIGCHPHGLIWAGFRDETECDLFSEQVLLCGGVSALLEKTYEVMIEAGYNPEAAYFESLYELKLIVDLIWKEGISGMRAQISPTARYGDLTRGGRVLDSQVKDKMKEVLSEIQSGKFAQEFLRNADSPEFKERVRKASEHPIEKLGAELRARLDSKN